VEGKYSFGGDVSWWLNIRYDWDEEVYYFHLPIDYHSLGPYYYWITAYDEQGNVFESEEYKVELYDNTPPSFWELEDYIFRTDEEFSIYIEAGDNVRVHRYDYDGIPIQSDNQYLNGSISERGIYHVTVKIEDEMGNEAEGEFLLVIESAETKNEIAENNTLTIVLLILVIILLIVVIIMGFNIYTLRRELEGMSGSDEDEGYEDIEGPFDLPDSYYQHTFDDFFEQ
jgi:hypothetical protein